MNKNESSKITKKQLKTDILEATILVFNKKGLKFTMDDIATELSISKKTIYTVFKDKESLFLHMVDYCFDKIKESEAAVMKDETMTTQEKIEEILGVMPESYKDVDFGQLYQLRDKYPKIYKKVEKRLENGWDNTIALINQGIEEGCVREVNVNILKTMMEATLEQFFSRDVLVRNKISYGEALKEVVNILVQGIIIK
jgi:AcrR family transcriptional regulator